MEKIGKKLKILRDLHGYSQESVAHALNINQKTYSRLENDEIQFTTERASQLAEYYNMGNLELYKFLETDEKVFIEKIADTNGVYNTNGSVVQNQGLTEVERTILFDQLKQQQKIIEHLMEEIKILKSK